MANEAKPINFSDQPLDWHSRLLMRAMTFIGTYWGVLFGFCWFQRPYTYFAILPFLIFDVVRYFRLPLVLPRAVDLFPQSERPQNLDPNKYVDRYIYPVIYFVVLMPLTYWVLCEVFKRYGFGCEPGQISSILRTHLSVVRGCQYYYPLFFLNIIIFLWTLYLVIVAFFMIKHSFMLAHKRWLIQGYIFKNIEKLIVYIFIAPPFILFFHFGFGYPIPSLDNFHFKDIPWFMVHFLSALVIFCMFPMYLSTSELFRSLLNPDVYRLYRDDAKQIQSWRMEAQHG